MHFEWQVNECMLITNWHALVLVQNVPLLFARFKIAASLVKSGAASMVMVEKPSPAQASK